MLQAPTGFGKTLTAVHIIQRALGKGKRVAFTVPAINLIDQTVSAWPRVSPALA
jgi:DNA repair protein RadD